MQQHYKPRRWAYRVCGGRRIILGERLRRRGCILRGRDTTRLIGTATRLTGLLTWRVDEDTRSRGGPHGSRHQRDSHRH
jgi:hypothetical protein